MKKIQDFNFQGKNVLVRCDFNVPLTGEKILDNFRIKSTIPTIKYLTENNARVILMSHLECRGKVYSLKCLIPELERLLNKKIFFVTDYLSKDARKKIEKSVKLGGVVLLENLRFHGEEKNNDSVFAQRLSKLGDIFINDAFSVCHREHASIVSLPKYLPSTAGFLLEKELETFSILFSNPKRPFVIIIGGAKIKSKTEAVVGAVGVADVVLIGSKIGEVILAQKGVLKNREVSRVKALESVILDGKIINPVDGVFLSKNNVRTGPIDSLEVNENVLDIGPKTIKEFKEIIKKANTILWGGSIGMHEEERFENGTREIAQAIIDNKDSFNVAGGGETVSFIKKFKLEKGFNFLSTGGSAMLNLLNEKELLGVIALNNKYGN